MKLGKRQGYRFDLYAGSGESGGVNLAVRRGRATAEYSVPTSFDGHRIHARLGRLGQISLRFVPSGPPRVDKDSVFPGCRGKPTTLQSGRFVGLVRFRGERGYASIRSHGARATIERAHRQVCKTEESGEEGQLALTSLNAFQGGRLFTAIQITGLEPKIPETVTYLALLLERKGKMWVNRAVAANAKAATLKLSDPGVKPFSASVSPPKPFHGSATLSEGGDGELTWTGSLSADFLGRGTVRLAGRSFAAQLCRDEECACTGSSGCGSTAGGE